MTYVSLLDTIDQTGAKTNWTNIGLLTLMFMTVNNCYWLTLFNVTNLGGSKLVNGLILGMAEMLSGVFVGIFITHSTPSLAFQSCSVVGVLFSTINQYLLVPGTLLAYMSLFIAFLGIGGTYTCIYVLIGVLVPQKSVGKAMVLITTIGTCASLLAPLIALADAPVPFIVIASLMFFSMVTSYSLDYLRRIRTGPKMTSSRP